MTQMIKKTDEDYSTGIMNFDYTPKFKAFPRSPDLHPKHIVDQCPRRNTKRQNHT
jgi:hypothetical protein